jgi:small-conductance mechanosensitive channel
LIVITLVVATVLVLILRKLLGIFVTKYAQKLKTDPTNFSFIKNSVGFVIYTSALIFIFYKIPYLKSLGTALFAGAGILAVIVGFASQKAFSNIISGIFILIFKPFRISDIIEFKDGIKGVVEEITLRHTLIRDYENRRIVIPNSVISDDTIINSNIQDERIRKHIEFGISYDSNVDKAIDIIRDEAEKHPLLIDNRSAEDIAKNVPLVIVRLIALSDFSVNLKAYVWSKGNDDAFVIKCDLLKSVKERFDNEGIEIPFPYRTIVFKKDLNDEENSSK